MFYIIVSIIHYVKNKFSIYSVSDLLFALLIFSTVSAYLTGRLLDLSVSYVFYELYIAALLYILFSSWNRYSNIKGYDFSDVNVNKLQKIERVIIGINGFVFIVDIIVFAAVFALLLAGVVHVNEYKNGGDSDLRQSVFANIMPSIFITVSYLLSSFGYFSLTLHFYYLVKKNAKRAILHLILSLTIVLVGIIGLSRSALVNYVIVYVIMFLFVVPLLNKKVFKKSFLAILIFGGAIGYVFSAISEDRFGESFYIESKSLIDEKEYPKLVSILDYFSQWEYFGPVLMEKYSGPSDLSWGLFNNNGVGVAILQRIYGSDNYNEASRKKIERVIGDTSSAFHGCIVRTIFDFGYIGTFLFVLLNCYFTKKWGPNKKKIISFKTLLTMPLILPFSIGFFSGSSYGQFFLNLGMIYMWLIFKYCRRHTILVARESTDVPQIETC